MPFRMQYQTQCSLLVPSGQMLFQGLSLVLGRAWGRCMLGPSDLVERHWEHFPKCMHWGSAHTQLSMLL